MRDGTLAALERLLVALLVGFLIGLDRERVEVRKARPQFAGVRTFPLIALAGAIPQLLADTVGPALLVASFVAVAAVALVSYLRSSAAGHVGATTEIAALATFLIGATAGAGQVVVAGAAGVTVAVLLVAKPPLEAFSRAVTSEEIGAALELAVISVIVLPLLPDRGYGPWQALNPREIWMVVVLVSALSFAGFVATRLLGPERGVLLAGAVGGLVSSTAVTMAMAERSRGATAPARAAASAVVLASTIMCVRMGLLAAVVNAGVLPHLLPVLGVMTAVGGAAAALLARGAARPTGGGVATIENPFHLRAALTFAGFYALVLLAMRAARELLDGQGLYLAAAVSAVADVDAPTIALARLGPGAGGWRGPAAAIGVAAVTNTLVKLGLAAGFGTGRFRGYTAAALGAMSLLGAVAVAAMFVAG